MKLAKISTLETEELACYITGLDYDEIDADEEIIAEKLNLLLMFNQGTNVCFSTKAPLLQNRCYVPLNSKHNVR